MRVILRGRHPPGLPQKTTRLLGVERGATRTNPPTSPNIAPGTKKMRPQNMRETCRKRMKRHLQWRTVLTGHLAPARSPRLVFRLRGCILYGKYNILRSGYLPKFIQISYFSLFGDAFCMEI